MTEPGQASFTLNGRPVDASATAPTTTLLQFVRDRGLVGTKEGCGDGDCGACTVVVTGEASDASTAYQAVNSCLLPIGACAGRQVLTVEGVSAPGAPLHPVQQAMVATAGSQCGYCTPGFVMSLFAGYHDPTRPAGRLGEDCVEGNLCRCTGYLPIRRAARSLGASTTTDPAPPRSERSARRPTRTAGAGREFHHPTTLGDALALLAAHPDAMLIAGGTDLGIELSHRRLDPHVTVALDGIDELRRLTVTDDETVIGAALPLTHLERRVVGRFTSLDEMIHVFAARQIRNRATVGGNLATASPIGDLPPVLLALDATVTIAGVEGTRQLPLDDFFTGYRTTVLQPGEIITAVTIPRQPATAVERSYKVGKRGSDDISIVSAAFRLELAAPVPTGGSAPNNPMRGATVTGARLAFGGVAATPVRAHHVEARLIGRTLDTVAVRETSEALREAFTPLDDLRGSAAYRRALTGNLFQRFAHQVAGVEA